jgi:hypothetical protein
MALRISSIAAGSLALLSGRLSKLSAAVDLVLSMNSLKDTNLSGFACAKALVARVENKIVQAPSVRVLRVDAKTEELVDMAALSFQPFGKLVGMIQGIEEMRDREREVQALCLAEIELMNCDYGAPIDDLQ